MMSYLNLKDRKNLRLTCKRFHGLSYNLSLIKNDVLKPKRIEDLDTLSPISRYVNLNLHNCEITAEFKVAKYWKSHGKVIKSIKEFRGIGRNPAFALLLSHCPNVEELVLSGVQTYRKSMKHERPESKDPPLKVSLKKLKRLEFCDFGNFDVLGVIENIFNNAPALIQLVISCGISGKECRQIIAFIENHSNMLIELVVEESYIPEGLEDLLIKLLEAAGPKLTHLAFHDSTIKLTAIGTIAKKLTNLRSLCTLHSDLHIVTDPLVIALPNLTELETDRLDGHPTSLMKLQNMTSVHLPRCKLSAAQLIAVFGEKELPQLKDLDLEFIASVDCNVLCKICPNLPNLQYLSLSGCSVKAKGLNVISKNNKDLKILSLNYWESMESEFLRQISLDYLIYLGLQGVPITENDFESVIRNCPKLLRIDGDSLMDHEILRERNRLRPFAFSGDYKCYGKNWDI